jgi:5-methylcytosine-specific restriction endonuclease McrA
MVKGKVEVVKLATRVISNAERTVRLILPAILRLIKFIRYIYQAKVPLNKRNILIRDNFECQYCGKKLVAGVGATVDHIVPRSLGGKTSFENCVSSCLPCNNKKDNRLPSKCGMFPKKRPTAPTVYEFIQLQIVRLGLTGMLKEVGIM